MIFYSVRGFYCSRSRYDAPVFIRFQQCEKGLRAHNLLRCKAWRIALRGRDHAAGKYCEKWARLFVRLDPGLARRRHCLGHFLLLKHKTEGLTSCTPVPNGYSQYFSTKLPTVYYTWFTESTLSVKSVFWHTHASHVFLNTPPFTDLLTRSSKRYPRHQSGSW